MKTIDLLIIGGGPAGMAAAVAAWEAGLRDILLLERDVELGGILQQCIHDGFGLHYFKEQLTGPAYAERFIDKIHQLGIPYQTKAMVIHTSKEKEVTYIGRDIGLQQVKAKAIVLAMGCRERTRGALAIPGTRPSGIMTAGTAQRYINMEGYHVGKNVFILGSGDIGLIMARRLHLEGAKVHGVAELMPFSGGLTRNIVQCLDDFDIPLYLSHTITAIHGKDRITGIDLAKVDQDRRPIMSTKRRIPVDTLLLSVGLIPENELTTEMDIDLDPMTKGPWVDHHLQTQLPGVFACGNVLHVHDLVDYVSKEGALAGKKAAAYLMDQGLSPAGIRTQAGKGVRYVLPQKIDGKNKVSLYFRVEAIGQNSTLVVKQGETLLLQKKKRFLSPGEMEEVKINPLEGNEPVEVSIEGGDAQ